LGCLPFPLLPVVYERLTMNEIKFTYVTGRTLTYTVRKPDGTLRGPADIPLLETPPSSGYYTNNDRPDLVVGDMVIIKDSKTGNNVGSGEWKPEDATDVKKGKDNVNVNIYGNVRARNFQIACDASIEEKKKGIIEKLLEMIGLIMPFIRKILWPK